MQYCLHSLLCKGDNYICFGKSAFELLRSGIPLLLLFTYNIIHCIVLLLSNIYHKGYASFFVFFFTLRIGCEHEKYLIKQDTLS